MEIISLGQSIVSGLSKVEKIIMQIDCINQKALNCICI